MKSILAVVADGDAAPVLATALGVAQRFKGHIVGLHAVTTEYAVVFGGEMGFSISSEVDRTLEREGQERREQARRVFREFMAGQQVPIGAAGAGEIGPTAEWREEEGRQNAVVGALGRVFDLIVVEQPAKLASLTEATLEDALFESGRPVLMAPTSRRGAIGDTIVIAWNGSSETARTVAFAKLTRGGIAASWRHVVGKGRTPGEIFLDEAMASGADLLVKGAYTQSRLRQMIFGGATRHIIMEATIPVLMAH